ncbi:hypothetical protein [Lishizhenia sp.]|uniref:hypothetical protein n=1 Tax=Lishizhenia sp. TaxID=2497594 RepID=UPI00299DACA4|nr:hypothetical protein [Lishizhenia sp.]MDX1447288.1 hypothetical protein [Lishizhenia sp.]
MFRLIIILLGVILIPLNSLGQDYAWWNETHNWDGYTPWYDYITTNTAHMGPNALPVPIVNQGRTLRNAELKIGTDLHFSPGDNTQNSNTSFYLPLHTPKVGLQVQIVPFEFYQTDTATRNLRAARGESGKGFAVGDFYVGTYVQVIENHRFWPDIMLSINLKTASGSKLSDARFTDSPAYFMDLSFGKNYSLNNSQTTTIRPFAMGGFYVWQMHGNAQQQDDAFLYGLGVKLTHKKLIFQSTLAGYYGYLNNGDRPLVFRAKLKTNLDRQLNYSFSFQKGLHDFPFNTFSINLVANFHK